MENVKYIPGDLVFHYGVKSIVDVVSWSQKRDDVCYGLHHLDGNDTSYQSFKKGQLIPINLTPAILETNGWKLMQQGIDDEGFEYGKYFKDYQFPTLIFYPHIRGQAQNMSALINDKDIKSNLLYCHQLQHLLSGLKIPSELKV